MILQSRVGEISQVGQSWVGEICRVGLIMQISPSVDSAAHVATLGPVLKLLAVAGPL